MKKILTLILTAALMFALSSLPVSAKTVHKECISLLSVRQNVSGAGYKWDNYNSVLTLDGLNVDTTDEYGLKIMDSSPEVTTVVLKGINYIKASKAAIFIEGKVLFKGNGTLTLVGGENGFYCSSADPTDSLSIVGGTYKITSGEAGISSAFHQVAISGSKITVTTEGNVAISAQSLTTGAKTVIKANGSLKGVSKLRIEGSTLTVESSTSALISDSPIVFSKLTLKAGDSISSLSNTEYSGEKCIKTTSTFDGSLKSAIFGDNVPFFVDILVLIAVIGAVTAAVVVPIIVKKKKAQAAIAARDEAEKLRKKANKKTVG